MSLRRALDALSDDRETMSAAREIVAFLDEHRQEDLPISRVSRATGVSLAKSRELLEVMAGAHVVDFLGDEREPSYRLSSSPVLALEIRRFVRSSSSGDSHLQRGADRFRGRYGSGR